MKTRNLFFISILALGIISVSCTQSGTKQSAADAETKDQSMEFPSVTIDPSQSKVMWAGTMLGVYTHEGTLNLTDASLSVEDGKIMGGSFTADMLSMVATDENYNPEEGSTPEKLIGHLSSADFFDVENFPTASFEITSAEGDMLKGNMTIRGNTYEEEVKDISIEKSDGMVKIIGHMNIDRKKYDVSWDSPAKEMVLSDDMELKIVLAGK
jgi:polyisoprenoid-binding protein YceI